MKLICVKEIKRFILLMICAVPLSSSVFAQERDISGNISIRQNDKEVIASNGMFNITGMPFEIIFDNVNLDDNIAIFAYHSDEMFNRYDYPIITDETVMFAPGTGLAMEVDENKSFFLRINTEMTQNYISSDRRINNTNQAVLRIKGFADTLNRFQEHKIAYLSIYIDYNKNGIIDLNEIKNIIIKVNQSIAMGEKTKVYISTMGSSLEVVGSENLIHNNFILFKITSQDEAERFSEYMQENTTYYSGYRTAGITNIDYNKNNKYFLMTPKGLSASANQPYHYSGEYDLIFDISDTNDNKNGNYVSLRTYTVSKDDDIFTIRINWYGEILTPIIANEY
jgi:hypothetical protein